MRFTKYNNPHKKHRRKVVSRADADILAAKNMLDNLNAGIRMPLSYYDAQSDRMCGKPSRNIYEIAHTCADDSSKAER